jgi:hypothetical protein
MKIDSQPQLPYVIFRNMSPHFDSHANSGIPSIKRLTHRFYSSRINTDANTIDLQFACPPEGQLMVEVEGNFLTPDHYVARGNGIWTTAGELTPPGSESLTQSASIVYNIRL